MKRYKIEVTLLLLVLLSYKANAQILFTESFNVITDSSKTVKGSVMPDLKFQTQKEDLIEFDNLADITMKIKNKNAITFANKIEFSRFGAQTLLSGGYLYGEYRRILESNFVLEPFAQVHWAEARGMEQKYAAGANLRYRILVKNKLSLFAGAGAFYEYERWNYQGVSNDAVVLPGTGTIEEQENIKLGSYISCKVNVTEDLFFDLSVYHQSRFDKIFLTPRIATSALGRIKLTKHLGLNLVHQFIYDYKPVVPIRKDFHKVMLGFSVSF